MLRRAGRDCDLYGSGKAGGQSPCTCMCSLGLGGVDDEACRHARPCWGYLCISRLPKARHRLEAATCGDDHVHVNLAIFSLPLALHMEGLFAPCLAPFPVCRPVVVPLTFVRSRFDLGRLAHLPSKSTMDCRHQGGSLELTHLGDLWLVPAKVGGRTWELVREPSQSCRYGVC